MKKFLIVVLLLGIVAAAFFTKPSDPKANFSAYLQNQASSGASGLPAAWNSMLAGQFADHCEYRDRLLWVDVMFNDKTIYTGAFSHWFNRAEIKNQAQNGVQTAREKIDQAADKLTGK